MACGEHDLGLHISGATWATGRGPIWATGYLGYWLRTSWAAGYLGYFLPEGGYWAAWATGEDLYLARLVVRPVGWAGEVALIQMHARVG